MDRSESLASTPGHSNAEPVVGEDPIERFEIIEQLGRGSYGCVYKAQDRQTGQIVALKTIPVMDSDDLSVIQKEIELLQDCDHPNIVSYLGSWRTSDSLWIAMEYCGGGSVSDLMQATGEPLEEDVISYICGESLKGLAYLHHMGKLHRDIKCGNILLNEQGHVKLADFGVAAQLTNTMSKRNTFIGTPHWMAPEVIQESRYDGKVDVWALGITGIEMAEVTPPRWTVHPMRVIFMISREPPPSLSQFDKWSLTFHDFVAQCLQKDPKSRPTTKHLLQHKFILRCPPSVQANAVVPLITAARQLSAERKMMEGGGTLLAEQGLRAVKKLSPAKGPWARTTAGWGRLAGLTFGVKDLRQSGSSDSVAVTPPELSERQLSTGTVAAMTTPGGTHGTMLAASGATLVERNGGTVDTVIDYSGTMQVNSEYGGTVAVHRSRDESDPDYAAAVRAAGNGSDDSYAAALRDAADRNSLRGNKRGGTTITNNQSAASNSREAQTSLLIERLRSLYMSENVIPLPFLRSSSAVSLVLKPYAPTNGNANSANNLEPFNDECFQVLVDVAMDSYSGAPSSRPDRSNALPQNAVEQVRNSPLLLSLIKTLAYQKRKLEEEVLTPAAIERVQCDINDISDTLRTILCL